MGVKSGEGPGLTRREFLKASAGFVALKLLEGSFPQLWGLAKGVGAEVENSHGQISEVDRPTANALLKAHWEIRRQIEGGDYHYRVGGGPNGDLPNNHFDWDPGSEISPIMPWGEAVGYNPDAFMGGKTWATVEMNPVVYQGGEKQQGIAVFSPMTVLGTKFAFECPDLTPGEIVPIDKVGWLNEKPFDVTTVCNSGQFTVFWLDKSHLAGEVVDCAGTKRITYDRPKDEHSIIHVYNPLYPTEKGLNMTTKASWLGQDGTKPSAYQYAGSLDLTKATLAPGGTLRYTPPELKEMFADDLWGTLDPIPNMEDGGQFVDPRILGLMSNLMRKFILGGDLGIRPTIEEILQLWQSTGSRFLRDGARFSQQVAELTRKSNFQVIDSLLRRIYNSDIGSLSTVSRDQLRQELVVGLN